MSDAINIGIDLGSRGLCVAWVVDPGGPRVLPASALKPREWLLLEADPESRLGVHFPSHKDQIGGGGPRSETAREQIGEAFREAIQAVTAATSRPVDQAVVAVPARYSTSQRSALREVAVGAGLRDVHLISDTLAAVIAHGAARREAATVLVCGLGHAGFELGLVRALRGHYRALGYEGGVMPSGQALDRLVMEALVAAMEQREPRLDTRHWDAAIWLQVRADAQRVKEELSTRSEARFATELETAEGRRLTVSLQRADLEQAVGVSFDFALGQTDSLVSHCNMKLSDLDRVLLHGGGAHIPMFRARLERVLGRAPEVLAPEALAQGAAHHAARLASKVMPGPAEPERDVVQSSEAQPGPAVRATVQVEDHTGVIGESPGTERLVLRVLPAAPSAEAPSAGLEHARRLIAAGRAGEARKLLEGLLQETRALLAEVSAGPAVSLSAAPTAAAPAVSGVPAVPLSSNDVLASRALARARKDLEKGRFEEAVRESHLAWQENRASPDLFEEMIDIHCQAALANPAPESYQDALRWLMCAYSHDESNVRIRQKIAERHYRQASHLQERGKRQEAREILERCLDWDPEHREGRELQQGLM